MVSVLTGHRLHARLPGRVGDVFMTRLRLLLWGLLAFVPGAVAFVSRFMASGACPGPCCK